MADRLAQGLLSVLAQHGARAPSATATAVDSASAVKRAASADITSIICCDLSLDEATLARVTGVPHSRATAS